MNRRKHKLYIVSPNGSRYEIGFLSPCQDGFVLGTRQIEGVETSHLTIIRKRDKIQAHITPQEQSRKREYFPPITKKETAKKLTSMIKENKIALLTETQLTENVAYITQRLLDWLDSLIDALYDEEASSKEVIHTLDFQKLMRRLPQLIEKLKTSASLFFGMCKAQDILKDPKKVFGFSSSRQLIVPDKNQLYGLDLSSILGFDFSSTLDKHETNTPFEEIYRDLGITRYMAEIESKGFLQKLLDRPAT